MDNTCPRCGNEITTFGGLSRLDNETRICTPCEIGESMEDYLDGKLTPKNEWFIFTGMIWERDT